MNPVMLIVDDNEEILDFLVVELSEKYTVLKATNGQEALTPLRQEVVNLIVCDDARHGRIRALQTHQERFRVQPYPRDIAHREEYAAITHLRA